MGAAAFRYEREAAAALDKLEASASERLWNRICDAIDLIVDRPDSREARAEELRGREGKAVWKVDVFDAGDNWAILWHRNSVDEVVIAWVGLWPPGTAPPERTFRSRGLGSGPPYPGPERR